MVNGIPAFKKKLQSKDDLQRRRHVERTRLRLAPTLQDLKTRRDVNEYCSKHRKTETVRRRMLERLELGVEWNQGESLQSRGWRNVAPRSFVEKARPATPPEFWLLDDIPSPKVYSNDTGEKKGKFASDLVKKCKKP